jgi:hypothetical protein
MHKVLGELRDVSLGPPRSTGGRWAKISPLFAPLWITLEQALPLSKRVRKKEGKSQRFG